MGFKLADNFLKKEKIKSILDYSFKEIAIRIFSFYFGPKSRIDS